MNVLKSTVALTLIKGSLLVITSVRASIKPHSRKQKSNNAKCISVGEGVVLAKCGKINLPSAATKSSFKRQDDWCSQGSIALNATDNSSVHSGCCRPSKSNNKSKIDL